MASLLPPPTASANRQMYSSLTVPFPSPSTIISAQEQAYRNAGLVKTKGTLFLIPPPKDELVRTFNEPPRPKTKMSSGAVALCKHFERRPWARYSDYSQSSIADRKKIVEKQSGGTGEPSGDEHVVQVGSVQNDVHGSNQDESVRDVEDFDNSNSNSTTTISNSEHESDHFHEPQKKKQKQKHYNQPHRLNWQHTFWPFPTGTNENKTRIATEVLEQMLIDCEKQGGWRNVMLLHRGVAVYEVRNMKGYGMRWTLDIEEVPSSSEASESGDKDSEGVGQNDTQRPPSESNNDSENDGDDANSKRWKIVKTTFRGFLEPIEGLDHELLSS